MIVIEKRLSTRPIFNGRIIKVREDKILLPNGRTASREVVDHQGGVCIAALTHARELLFVKQYRYPYEDTLLELPAGKLESGENPLESGKRELLEETGAVGVDYQSMGLLYPSPGYCAEIIHLYTCDVVQMNAQCPDDDEFLDVVKIPLDQAVSMVLENKIRDAKTQVLTLKVAARLLSQKGM